MPRRAYSADGEPQFLRERCRRSISTALPSGTGCPRRGAGNGWWARVRALYQQRYPLIGGGAGVPRKLLEALQKIRWYELVPDDIYLIDNTLGFAHREHMPVK